MVDSVLEHKIRNVIEDVYNCKCLFKITAKVIVEDAQTTYITYLYIHGFEENPLHIIWEGASESDFLDWLWHDLKARNLVRSSHININVIHE